MWQNDWRNRIWVRLGDPWDIIVVGGGITGAGILREAARLGLRALLVDKKDFSWGTSSRSTKLVHGGLRYLKQGQFGVTYHSVRERERLLREGPGLIEPLGFLMATYEGDTSRRVFGAGLAMYDLFASRRDHQYYAADDFQMLAPHVSAEKLEGGFRYGDALTDDARLVLRIIREAVRDGAAALNYAAAERLLLDTDGHVNGVRLRDQVTDRAIELQASVVINATGAWADRLRIQVGGQARIRPSRGSHLIFPAWRFPAAQAITLWHPDDHRPVFVIPWEGGTLVGTTDLDHQQPLDEEPQIDSGETAYLMAVLEARFPKLHLGLEDVLASFAGIRPIVGTGKEDPSKESRAHTVVVDEGLITVTGGKLTTYRLMCHRRWWERPNPWTVPCAGASWAGMLLTPRRSLPPHSPANWSASLARDPCGPSCDGPPETRAWFTSMTCCCAACAWGCCCRKAPCFCCTASVPSYSPSWAGATSYGRGKSRGMQRSGQRATVRQTRRDSLAAHRVPGERETGEPHL